VTVAYAEPARFGVDRWLALLAARREAPGSALVLDVGTAVTYDLLLADGRHLGGLILPGMRMMRESLLAGTRIPAVEPADSLEPWAADTAPAVAAASVQAPAALTERLRDRLAAAAGEAPTVLITGGDAERLVAALDRPARFVPDLVLRGLALLPEI
jgi:type III pantothenate kinase